MNGCNNCEQQVKTGTTRRRFLVVMMAVAASLLGLLLGIPFVRSVIGAGSVTKKENWVKLADLQAIPVGEPVRLNFMQAELDAFIQQTSLHSVWVIRNSETEITAYSPICPHAGCYYNWSAQLRRFACPCHASVFELNGPVVSGPAPRPLDTLPVKIENGSLFLIWKRFRSGVAEKIEL
jgi:menaquinol-cytochrome c reductase iron-sulfur subunit